MGFPEDLLEQARHLATLERPGRPKQASLRRAVSTAYYALFHFLVEDATKNWKRSAQRAVLARAFEHGSMKKVCEQLRAELARRPGTPRSEQLSLVAETFVDLQQKRQTADYDSQIRWPRTTAIAAIDSAVAAFEAWRAIREEPEAQDFLLALLVKRR